jgi:hypothetical protein
MDVDIPEASYPRKRLIEDSRRPSFSECGVGKIPGMGYLREDISGYGVRGPEGCGT